MLILLISRAELNFAFDVVTSFAPPGRYQRVNRSVQLVVHVTFERTDHHAVCCCVPFLYFLLTVNPPIDRYYSSDKSVIPDSV